MCQASLQTELGQ
jgi:hypothetical protein